MTVLTAVFTAWLLWVLFTVTFIAAASLYSARRPGRALQHLPLLQSRILNRQLESAHRVRTILRLHGIPAGELPRCDAMAERSKAFATHKAGVLLTWAVPAALIFAAMAAVDLAGQEASLLYIMLLTTTALAIADARITARGTVFASTTRAAMEVVELLGTGPEVTRRSHHHQGVSNALSASISTLCQAALTQARALSARTDPYTRERILTVSTDLVANFKGARARLLRQPQASKDRIAHLCASILTQATKPHESELHPVLVIDPAILQPESEWHPSHSPRRRTVLAVTVQASMVLALLAIVVALAHFQVPELVVLLVLTLIAALFARILIALDLPATDWLRVFRR
ncbi:hypothetical protein ACFRAR_14835 [Kitasatospora sp. NPDC056651]|uniref:hypothetical protein n=1 Tax=Kitasatospora sp. NPDC056651 TaxID=3345892 RepID=UPI00368DED0B